MIKPTIGRVVWFTPPQDASDRGFCVNGSQPMVGIVCYVWSDECVNLKVLDHAGNDHNCTSVPLVQENEPKPLAGFYCEWMPYQIGQAKRHEEREDNVGVGGITGSPA